ncbi:unnamed protein product [Tuber melanosporum]|uniref:(Perigord truffle) hypothetical protein n=1 Tax=Tuber melanosporum (strain Mel28) TaxID=656061 RepID=D5GF61_TUBMM|nr:uncharacterized protein GSTUM_00006732001 [Tuber melanosporum]CAZ83154.1 unnamed protein product [Tuber melanosporum]
MTLIPFISYQENSTAKRGACLISREELPYVCDMIALIRAHGYLAPPAQSLKQLEQSCLFYGPAGGHSKRGVDSRRGDTSMDGTLLYLVRVLAYLFAHLACLFSFVFLV